jgi:modification methylase
MPATTHLVVQGDARDLSWLSDESIHLVVTSPPYGVLKAYEDVPGNSGTVTRRASTHTKRSLKS